MLPDGFFRTLTPDEETSFRAWARANHVLGRPADPCWHPIVREEWARLDKLENEGS
jgi:hypothetical protein